MFLGLHTDWKVFPLKKKVENKTLLASTLKKKEETCPIFSTCKIVCMRNCVMWHFQYSSEYLKYFLTSVEDTRKRMDSSKKHITRRNSLFGILEIKPCGLGSRIRDVEAFWYATEIKIIYFGRFVWLYGLPWH